MNEKNKMDVIDKEYASLLVGQFKRATGIKSTDLDSEESINEFKNWLITRRNISKHYLSMLDSMNISRIYERETAEVGKGCVDSIVIPYDTTIMSEYTNGIIMVEKSRIIPSGMIVVEGTPVAFNIDKESRETSSLNTSKVKTSTKYKDSFSTFMTQNPYVDMNIACWEQLHNSGRYNIVVGVYGSTYDKDIDAKIKRIKELESKLSLPYVKESGTVGDAYCYTVASESLVKSLVRTR